MNLFIFCKRLNPCKANWVFLLSCICINFIFEVITRGHPTKSGLILWWRNNWEIFNQNCESTDWNFCPTCFCFAEFGGDYPRKHWKSTLNRCGKGRVWFLWADFESACQISVTTPGVKSMQKLSRSLFDHQKCEHIQKNLDFSVVPIYL